MRIEECEEESKAASSKTNRSHKKSYVNYSMSGSYKAPAQRNQKKKLKPKRPKKCQISLGTPSNSIQSSVKMEKKELEASDHISVSDSDFNFLEDPEPELFPSDHLKMSQVLVPRAKAYLMTRKTPSVKFMKSARPAQNSIVSDSSYNDTDFDAMKIIKSKVYLVIL